MQPIKLGFWGTDGHQIHNALNRYPQLQLIAAGELAPKIQEQLLARDPDLKICATFEDLLNVPGLEMVSLCSSLRSVQAQQAIDALAKNIHVYAEKPCATCEADLDRIMQAAAKSKGRFHEMAGTVFEQPYWAMKQIVASGAIGQVVQVLAQKSYPMHPGRPTRETVDGGLVAQNGVHAMRFVEHITGIKAANANAMQTSLGETRDDSDLQMACHITGQLANGGLYAIIANYLNPKGFGSWGNEMVRIFGTKGMIESTDAGTRTRLVVGDKDHGTLDTSTPSPDWLAMVIDDCRNLNAMPIDLETELHPTRMVLRARAAVQRVTIR